MSHRGQYYAKPRQVVVALKIQHSFALVLIIFNLNFLTRIECQNCKNTFHSTQSGPNNMKNLFVTKGNVEVLKNKALGEKALVSLGIVPDCINGVSQEAVLVSCTQNEEPKWFGF